MAAPDYVPLDVTNRSRAYTSPPRRAGSWWAERPGDLGGTGQPDGPALGTQGPDQGYALKIAHHLADRLHLAEGEHLDDVLAGSVAVALKRASAFGRAPVTHDLLVAFTVFGYLDPAPDGDLVELRRGLFEEVSSPHHYFERRSIPDLVPVEALRRTPVAVTEAHAADWRSLLALGA